jgi:hypothetical protein
MIDKGNIAPKAAHAGLLFNSIGNLELYSKKGTELPFGIVKP